MPSQYQSPALEPALQARREALIASLRITVGDERVVEAMASVRRDLFVPADSRHAAYEDRALAIGGGQTISQPQIVAVMTAALELCAEETVLDVGTGSGYLAAILSMLARKVVSVERVPALAASACERLRRLGYTSVEVHLSRGELGWPLLAPYDAIVVAASAPVVPRALVDQLALGGRLVIPVGTRDQQVLIRATKSDGGKLIVDDFGPCQFVPLIGPGSWRE